MNIHVKPSLIYIEIALLLICCGLFYNNESTSIYTDNRLLDIDCPTPVNSSGNIQEPQIKKVAITFDDGPHPKYTPKLLDGLKARNVPATFFVIGESANQYPEILKRISDEGHLIGNHTYTHVQLTCIPHDKAVQEILSTNNLIKDITGKDVSFIRPPYGSYKSKFIAEMKLTPVLWTVDPRDWSVLNTNSVVRHVLSRVKNNDIILLHDIFDTSVDAALQIIDALQAQGYTFVTVDQILNDKD